MKDKDQAKILAKAIYQAMQDKDNKEIIANFSSYLKDHRLVYLIPVILKELEKINLIATDHIAASVTSKDELDNKEVNKIKNIIEERSKKKVIIKQELDQNILGGVVIKYQDKLLDLSLKKQLNNLSKQLSN
jgi:F-type H+-transporting ATPase subunit delta